MPVVPPVVTSGGQAGAVTTPEAAGDDDFEVDYGGSGAADDVVLARALSADPPGPLVEMAPKG